MLKKDLEAAYDEEHRCETTYVNGMNQQTKGILLSGIEKHGRRLVVAIDSYVNKIPLRRVISVTKTSTKW